MTSVVCASVTVLTLLGSISVAHADTCTQGLHLGKTQCVQLKLSKTDSLKATTVFGTDGTLTFGKSVGTYSCSGQLGLLEVDYVDSNGDTQQWFATAGPGGNHVGGNGKSATGDYMYTVTGTIGTCKD